MASSCTIAPWLCNKITLYSNGNSNPTGGWDRTRVQFHRYGDGDCSVASVANLANRLSANRRRNRRRRRKEPTAANAADQSSIWSTESDSILQSESRLSSWVGLESMQTSRSTIESRNSEHDSYEIHFVTLNRVFVKHVTYVYHTQTVWKEVCISKTGLRVKNWISDKSCSHGSNVYMRFRNEAKYRHANRCIVRNLAWKIPSLLISLTINQFSSP